MATKQRAGRWRAAYPLSVWDTEETWFETNPWSTDSDSDSLTDGTEDADHDGSVDDGETDPLKKDSDGDSLEDGVEANTYGCDPTVMDTDGDGLTDGQEVDGWDVAIYWQVSKEAKGDPRHVTSDPTDTDTDDDGMTDFDEFKNGCDPNNTDTDGDTIDDLDELTDSDTENTPTAFDGIAPKISKFKTKTRKKSGWNLEYVVEIKFKVQDLAGVDKVSCKISGQKRQHKNLKGTNSQSLKFKFKADWGRSLGGGYDVKMDATDVNGNKGKAKEHIPGVMESIVKALIELIQAIVEAIAKLASMFIDFIWGCMKGLMDTVVKPVVNAIKGWVRGVGNALSDCFNEYQNNGDISENSANKIIDAMFGSFYYVLLVIFTIISGISTIISPFLLLVGGLVGSVVNFLLPIIINAIGGTVGKALESFSNIVKSGVAGIINAIPQLLGIELGGAKNNGRGYSTTTLSFLAILINCIGIIFSQRSFLQLTGDSKEQMRRKANAETALIWSVFGLTLSLFSFMISASCDGWGAVLLAAFALIVAGAGWAFSLLALIDKGDLKNGFAFGISTACAAVGVISLKDDVEKASN